MRKFLHNLFQLVVFLSGIVIGSIYTPGIITFSRAIEDNKVEQEPPRPAKPRPSESVRLV